MTTSLATAPNELMRKHVTVLRDYARRVFTDGSPLTVDEDRDRMRRIAEFRAIGTSFKLTEKEVVKLVLTGVFGRKARCGCPTCRSR